MPLKIFKFNWRKTVNKKKVIVSVIYIIGIVAIMGIYTLVYNAVCFVETPNLVGMTVSEAITELEKADIETPEHIHMYKIEKENSDKTISNEEKYQDSIIVRQEPSAGEKFKIRDGLLESKSSTLDLMTLLIQ